MSCRVGFDSQRRMFGASGDPKSNFRDLVRTIDLCALIFPMFAGTECKVGGLSIGSGDE
jgi:hypothetical protein